ncbi:hypothetical protein ACLMJK_001946 [Lecanora helva]
MTSYFGPNDLPGSKGKSLANDIAAWSEVWDTAEDLYNNCVDEEDSAGWASAGNKGGVGIFFWSTDSAEAELVEAVDAKTAES